MKASSHALRLMVVAAALATLLSGCISDTALQASGGGNGQLRYYGGPKEPRWPVTP